VSELTLLRQLAPETEAPSAAAHALAARRLRHAARAEQRPPRIRRRALIPGLGFALAAVAAAVAIALGVSGPNAAPAAAAQLLTRAAEAARQQPSLVPLPPGRYLYVKSIDAYLATSTDPPPYSVLVPHVREIWLGGRRSYLHETSGKPVFLSERDRRRWIAAGRPPVTGQGASITAFRARSLDLPSDPNQAYEQLVAQARAKDSSFAWAMFQLIGDGLRETLATPEQRAALFAAAARVPGIVLIGHATDGAGRRGIAIAVRDDSNEERLQLIVDPKSGDLLAEQEVVLAGNPFGYPAGTVIGSATYVETALVAGKRARP